MQQLSLIIPEFYAKYLSEGQSKLPYLSLLISRARQKIKSTDNFEQFLFHLFNFADLNPLPIAAITGLADGIDTAKNYWLRLDPVEFRADLSAIYLLGNTHLSSIDEALLLLSTKFHELLAEENIVLHTPLNERWYLSVAQDPQIKTALLTQLIGKDIGKSLPKGPRGFYWQKLTTELQMLLHMQRQNQREGTVNGFWLWGEGQLPPARKIDWEYVCSDEPLAKGLAMLNHTSFLPLSQDYFVAQQQMESAKKAMVVISNLQNKSFLDLENNWFLPIVKALRDKSLKQVDCYLGGGFTYSITQNSIRYFWRRKREL